MKTTIPLTVLLTSLFVMGCSGINSTSVKPTPKKKMKDIMTQGFSKQQAQPSYRRWQTSPATTPDSIDYSRSESRELKGLFPRLPNPDLCMYVYPHLSLEQATVPGYTSCFSLYDKNHYALPGEATAIWQSN